MSFFLFFETKYSSVPKGLGKDGWKIHPNVIGGGRNHQGDILSIYKTNDKSECIQHADETFNGRKVKNNKRVLV